MMPETASHSIDHNTWANQPRPSATRLRTYIDCSIPRNYYRLLDNSSGVRIVAVTRAPCAPAGPCAPSIPPSERGAPRIRGGGPVLSPGPRVARDVAPREPGHRRGECVAGTDCRSQLPLPAYSSVRRRGRCLCGRKNRGTESCRIRNPCRGSSCPRNRLGARGSPWASCAGTGSWTAAWRCARRARRWRRPRGW